MAPWLGVKRQPHSGASRRREQEPSTPSMADNGSLSRISLTSSPTRRRSPPQSGQQVPGIEFAALADRICRYAGATAHDPLGRDQRRRCQHIRLIDRCGIRFGRGDHQVFKRQLQLFDLALDLFRRLAESLLPQLGDAQPSCRRRAFSATPGSAGHGRARWRISWRSLPAKPRSSPSEGRDHQGDFGHRWTCD